MKPFLLATVLLAGCTCDIHIDSASPPKVALGPPAPPPKPTHEFTTSYANTPADLARIKSYGWTVTGSSLTAHGTVYQLTRPIGLAERPQ